MQIVSGQESLFGVLSEVNLLVPLPGKVDETERVCIVKEEVLKKIRCVGPKGKQQKTENLIKSLPLTGDEASDRLLIQKALDATTGPATVLYGGNTVYPSKQIISELLKMKRTGTIEKMTDGLYNFLSLNFDIAHYDKHGYIDYYDGEWNRLWDKCLADAINKVSRWRTDVDFILKEAGLKNVKSFDV